jgi:ABC-type transport system involved in cytochrome bd biosynthesis fused ATPase/permease subunit
MAEAGYADDEKEQDEDTNGAQRDHGEKVGFSSGERMLKVLKEIVDCTDDAIYLLDEWDANLDATNRAEADKLVDRLATRARVIEISHRDKESTPPRRGQRPPKSA